MTLTQQLLSTIESLAESLAWPLATVAIVVLLRDKLRGLLERLEKAETQWGSVTFRDALVQTRQAYDRIAERRTRGLPRTEVDALQQDELFDPQSEIQSAWAQIERLCEELLMPSGSPAARTFQTVRSKLVADKLIDVEHAEVLQKLHQLRNMAAHSRTYSISAQDAHDFLTLANQMVEYLNGRLMASRT